MNKIKLELCNKQRTGKLWPQYLHYVEILKHFIRRERTGDWLLHLYSIEKMINLFVAKRHLNYAKSIRLSV